MEDSAISCQENVSLFSDPELVKSVLIESENNDNRTQETMEDDTKDNLEESSASRSQGSVTVTADIELVESVLNESQNDDDDDGSQVDGLPSEREEQTMHSEITSRKEPHQPILKSYDQKMYQNKNRDFNPQYFKKYPWTSFNPSSKCIECFACQTYLGDSSFQYSNWKKPEKLKKHNQSKGHSLSMAKWLSYQINQRRNTSISMQLNSAHQLTVKQNRDYLRIIIETLVFTAQQNIAQRGVDENRHNLPQPSDTNRGNFLELLHLRSRDIPWLAGKLQTQSEAHRQWLSLAIQNELLGIFAEQVVELIIGNVARAQEFGLIVDETTNISNNEQVSICLRYVLDGTPYESFIGFCQTSSTTGEVLFKLVKSKLQYLGIEIKHLVGLCYNGAANMSGCEKGVATRFQNVAPHALYVHCYAHLLNLALQSTLEENQQL